MLTDIKHQQILLQIIAAIKKAQTIILLQHQNPDGDALGSSWGLGHFLKQHFPTKKIFGWVEKIPPYLSFLTPLPNFTPAGVYSNTLVIVNDTPQLSRVDGWVFTGHSEVQVIKIDHHLNGENFADLNISIPEYIANAQLVAELVFQFQLPIPLRAAQALYTGILTDSNRFLYHRTNARTLAVASKLLTVINDRDLDLIHRALYDKKYQFFVMQNLLMKYLSLQPNGLAFFKLTEHVLQKLHITGQVAKAHLSFFLAIKEIKILIMVWARPAQHPYIKFSVRSKDISIYNICVTFGGGGHDRAGAGYLQSWDQLTSLLTTANQLLKP